MAGSRAPGPRPAHLGHFCLTLDKADWEGLRARVAARDIPIEGPLPRWGARGNATSIYFHDPEGNEIEARYYDEETGLFED